MDEAIQARYPSASTTDGYDEAFKIWCRYHFEGEHYDRTVCSTSENGEAVPKTGKERRLVHRHDKTLRAKTKRAIKDAGISPEVSKQAEENSGKLSFEELKGFLHPLTAWFADEVKFWTAVASGIDKEERKKEREKRLDEERYKLLRDTRERTPRELPVSYSLDTTTVDTKAVERRVGWVEKQFCALRDALETMDQKVLALDQAVISLRSLLEEQKQSQHRTLAVFAAFVILFVTTMTILQVWS